MAGEKVDGWPSGGESFAGSALAVSTPRQHCSPPLRPSDSGPFQIGPTLLDPSLPPPFFPSPFPPSSHLQALQARYHLLLPHSSIHSPSFQLLSMEGLVNETILIPASEPRFRSDRHFHFHCPFPHGVRAVPPLPYS